MTIPAPAPSPYKSDNTASNMCGFTLMNNQIGAVVAQVMATKPNVTVTPLMPVSEPPLAPSFLAWVITRSRQARSPSSGA